jgi:hypothetical protein
MGARAEALAKQFEAKAQEATGVLEDLSDADWPRRPLPSYAGWGMPSSTGAAPSSRGCRR